jgi:type IV pilus assembly protein PilN
VRTIHLNLASEPYRDVRPVWATIAGLAAVTMFLLVYNVATGYRYFVETKETRARIAELETETRAEQKRANDIDAVLKAVDMKSLNAQTRFINDQILARSFSWSNLLDQLEVVVPSDVRLISLSPAVQKDGSVLLSLACAAKSQDGLIRLLNRFFADPHFRRAFPSGEQTDPAGGTTFNVSVEYLPEIEGGRS